MPASTTIQLRRGTATAWTTANSVLAAGEIGFETDTKKFKIGDGTTTWTALGYFVTDVTSVAGRTGAVVLTKTDVGLSNVDNTSDASKPVSTATTTALAAKEGSIAAGTTGQYWRGDKTWVTLDKTAVGLANVDNTSDASKPLSTAANTALAAKEPSITAGTTAQYWRGDKTWASTFDGGTP